MAVLGVVMAVVAVIRWNESGRQRESAPARVRDRALVRERVEAPQRPRELAALADLVHSQKCLAPPNRIVDTPTPPPKGPGDCQPPLPLLVPLAPSGRNQTYGWFR